jgi:hypothetical protein
MFDSKSYKIIKKRTTKEEWQGKQETYKEFDAVAE